MCVAGVQSRPTGTQEFIARARWDTTRAHTKSHHACVTRVYVCVRSWRGLHSSSLYACLWCWKQPQGVWPLVALNERPTALRVVIHSSSHVPTPLDSCCVHTDVLMGSVVCVPPPGCGLCSPRLRRALIPLCAGCAHLSFCAGCAVCPCLIFPSTPVTLSTPHPAWRRVAMKKT